MIILGIDPGFGRVGWGVVEKINGNWTHVAHGCIETFQDKTFLERLEQVSEQLRQVIEKYKPDHSAVEELFFSKNAKTVIDVAQARGVIMLTINQQGIPIMELTPLQVKQAIVGYGRAEKTQVQKMLKILLQLEKIPKQDDAADALAVAMACASQINFQKKVNG
ncbi:crossover junction endodeoxyribonuclease RuvC [Candidatus Nomurabacteria bacterium]|nr:crossover junction endodeoxyribonuclease RuvC [Candidatus Nomurabacteria bacterium]